MFETTLVDEYLHVIEHMEFSGTELVLLAAMGFDNSFLNDQEKGHYLTTLQAMSPWPFVLGRDY
jgi:adenosine deaminase